MNNEKQPDKTLLFTVLALLAFGLIMIASAGVIYSQTRFGDGYYFFKHQLFYGVLPGFFVLYFFQKIDYRFWKKFAVPFFFGIDYFADVCVCTGGGLKGLWRQSLDSTWTIFISTFRNGEISNHYLFSCLV